VQPQQKLLALGKNHKKHFFAGSPADHPQFNALPIILPIKSNGKPTAHSS
jgi:hypothetical protein